MKNSHIHHKGNPGREVFQYHGQIASVKTTSTNNLTVFHTVASEQKRLKFRAAINPYSISSLASNGYCLRKRKRRPANFQAMKCVVPDDVGLAIVRNPMSKMVSNS
ncbi:hypothetical protein TNCV_988161 [Trichonephila clavipes]|nr:hypothetical protein TNCV_988161 [Trichonephila clavipes]